MADPQVRIDEAKPRVAQLRVVSVHDELSQIVDIHLRRYLPLKRAMDIVGATVGLLVFAPVLILAMILIKLSSPGPVFFSQWRAGKNGVPFRVYKLRTMVNGAQHRKEQLLGLNEQDGPAFKMSHDPRTTKIGGFLRKSSLDEVPQFFNVLLGHMSIVGPRPFQLDEARQFTPSENLRHLVKPGITCYWQVEGRNALTFRQWMEKDLRYVRACSFVVDVGIIARTVHAVCQFRGK